MKRFFFVYPNAFRSVLVGSLLLSFTGLSAAFIWKMNQGSTRGGQKWLVEAGKLDRPLLSPERTMGLAAIGVFMEASDREEDAIAREAFLGPLKNFLRKEAQFPQLRMAENSGCILVSLSCQTSHGRRADHFGEAIYRDKYEIAFAAYVALGSAIAMYSAEIKDSGPSERGALPAGRFTTALLSQCHISRDGGVLALDRSRCQSTTGGNARAEGAGEPSGKEVLSGLSLRL